MNLTFYGGAKSVTGSNYLLESNGRKILIDCGLRQGSNYAERQNFEPFPYEPSEIEAVFVTHAHIDHIGLLPKLIKNGFKGTVYSNPATKDFAELMLIDSEHILGQEAEREGKQPIYTTEDIENLLKIWQGVEYHQLVTVSGFTAEFFDAGHILGSSIIRIKAAAEGEPRQGREGKTILFSGDLGNSPAPIIQPTEKLDFADYCLIESAYGNRFHEAASTRKEVLEDVIEETVKVGGVLMIPAFAMERTQELLFNLNELFKKGSIPEVPVFIDSPLAIRLTTIYKKYESHFNNAVLKLERAGDDVFNFPGLKFTLTTEQSKEINNVPAPKIIIAGSGMSNAGRILHHEQRYLPDPKSTLLFVGYQTVGSMGRRILDGAKTVKIYGEEIQVRCRIKEISAYSAHADQGQLLAWLKPLRLSLKKVFVVQGEEGASEILAGKIRDDYAIEAVVPEAGQTVVL
ncbi:MAG: MBL fold metallo-hydrolase [Candidatus Liptonbacteria bacterium]|nr:MBL fold metallo-hydrolase [Candidatus Liptonbacteria bacterium]